MSVLTLKGKICEDIVFSHNKTLILLRFVDLLRGVWNLKYGCFFGKIPKGGGSFPIQKITLQIFLVSRRYILVVNFGKNVHKGGEGVPVLGH